VPDADGDLLLALHQGKFPLSPRQIGTAGLLPGDAQPVSWILSAHVHSRFADLRIADEGGSDPNTIRASARSRLKELILLRLLTKQHQTS
jgi:hypothetical protein